MTTRILDYRRHTDQQPARDLWGRYRPERARWRFVAREAAAAGRWQREARRALAAAVGFQDEPRVAPRPRRVERTDKRDYWREKWVIRTGPRSVMPVYLLLPKRAARPLPVVLALHGHGYGVKDIVGLWEDGSEREVPDGYHKDFAVALCRRGFAVAAPEIACFGERQSDFSHLDTLLGQVAPTTCTHAAMLAFHLGKSVVGWRVHESRRLVDYLATRPELDTRRLGAMGISGGGMLTFFTSCLEPRIRAAVISGYYATFRESVLAMSHCACNFVPGLHQAGEMYDLAGLIAPRPLLIENGTRDPIFPIGAVRRSVARARAVYGVFGARDAIQTDYFEGRHQISGVKAYDFLWRELVG